MNQKVVFSISLIMPVVALIKSFDWMNWRISLGYLLLVSLLAFGANFLDKRRAEKGACRISEKLLHLFELLGAWPAAFITQQWLRHKTVKKSYRIVYWLIVLLYQLVALDYLLDWRFLNVSAGY